MDGITFRRLGLPTPTQDQFIQCDLSHGAPERDGLPQAKPTLKEHFPKTKDKTQAKGSCLRSCELLVSLCISTHVLLHGSLWQS